MNPSAALQPLTSRGTLSPNGTYSSYTLAEKLNPTVKRLTPAAEEAFIATRDATEQLIVKGLVDGERNTGANGVYFDKLKLTRKGQQAAIQQTKNAKEFEKKLPEFIKQANAVAEEIRKSEDKE